MSLHLLAYSVIQDSGYVSLEYLPLSPKLCRGKVTFASASAVSPSHALNCISSLLCKERICIELMTSGRKLKASREGSK